MISPTEALALARNDLAVITERLPRALKAIHAAQPGIRSVPTDSPSSSHGGDPTPQAAHTRSSDPAVRALADLTDAIVGARQRADKALNTAGPPFMLALPIGYGVPIDEQARILSVSLALLGRLPHSSLPTEAREWVAVIPEWTRRAATIVTVWTARPTTAGAHLGDPGCQWMSRHNGPWEEARYSIDHNGTRLRVGQRTYRWHRNTGEMPTPEVIRAWAQGRVPRRTIDPTKKGTAA